MNRAFAILSLTLIAFLFPSCSGEIRGEFGWSAVDDRGILEPERSLLTEREFRLGRENLYFYNYETIWWIYKIDQGSYDADDFIAVLYEHNYSPEPVEVDMRRVTVHDAGWNSGYIRQSYTPLKPGSYILKIAHKSAIVDEVHFQVVPRGGPSAINGDDFIPDDTADGDEENVDEIIRYSSHNNFQYGIIVRIPLNGGFAGGYG